MISILPHYHPIRYKDVVLSVSLMIIFSLISELNQLTISFFFLSLFFTFNRSFLVVLLANLYLFSKFPFENFLESLKNPQNYQIIFILVLIGLSCLFLGFFMVYHDIKSVIMRKYFHIAPFSVIYLLADYPDIRLWAPDLILLAAINSMLLYRFSASAKLLQGDSMFAHFYLLLSFAAAIILNDRLIADLWLADAAAALTGTLLKRKTKSFEGSLAFWAVYYILQKRAFEAVIMMLIERLPLNDNGSLLIAALLKRYLNL